MTDRYVLDDRTPRKCDSLEEWAAWFSTANRSVCRTAVGEAIVSTVFLGIDHNHLRQGAPILFETMIHGVSADEGWDHQTRYATYAEAEEGHALAVEWAQSVIGLADSITGKALNCLTPP